MPVEVFEVNSPALIEAKELIPDSAGAGKFRGSPGQRVVVGKLPSHSGPLNVYIHPNRLTFAPQGAFGGGSGAKTEVIINGDRVSDDPRAMTSGAVPLEDVEDRLVLEFPSGAGVGEPSERPDDLLETDLSNGLVSEDGKRKDYGIV